MREFDVKDPSLWFSQLELQFEAQAVVEERKKFVLLMSVIGEDQSHLLNAIAKNPPSDPYKVAKRRLIDAFALSVFQRLEAAFDMTRAVGEEKPTLFLSRFRLLLQDATMDDIECWMVFRTLPEGVKLSILGDHEIKDADGLAKAADGLEQSVAVQPSCAQVDIAPVNAVLVKQPMKRERSMEKRDPKPFTLCRFHTKFGPSATKCAGTMAKKCPMWSRKFSVRNSGNEDHDE